MPHLFAAYLGGPLVEGRMGEDHEVVLVVAEDELDARAKSKAKWRGAGRPHVDALQQIRSVDGYRVTLTEGAGGGDDFALYGYNE